MEYVEHIMNRTERRREDWEVTIRNRMYECILLCWSINSDPVSNNFCSKWYCFVYKRAVSCQLLNVIWFIQYIGRTGKCG